MPFYTLDKTVMFQKLIACSAEIGKEKINEYEQNENEDDGEKKPSEKKKLK